MVECGGRGECLLYNVVAERCCRGRISRVKVDGCASLLIGLAGLLDAGALVRPYRVR